MALGSIVVVVGSGSAVVDGATVGTRLAVVVVPLP